MAQRGSWRAWDTSTFGPAPAFRRLRVEPLEDRRLLNAGGHSIELFETSPALFVENQRQWDDNSAGTSLAVGDVEADEAATPLFGPPEALNPNAGSDSGYDSFPPSNDRRGRRLGRRVAFH